MVFLCTLCSYRSDNRMDLIKHYFATHSMEPNFRIVCGIKGCAHSFVFGSTFSSFKSHACRKHPNWQQCVNESESLLSDAAAPQVSVTLDAACDGEVDPVVFPKSPNTNVDLFSVSVCDPEPRSQPRPRRSAQEAAALFLLTFKEQYKLPQRAIDFAVGSIKSILSGVCATLQESMQVSLQQSPGCNIDFQELEDPFYWLQTEYMQTKFYRDVFGLVVSCLFMSGELAL